MPKTIRLDVVTAERLVYSNDITMIIARATDGDIGILPEHVPLVAGLITSPVRIKKVDSTEETLFVGGGFMEVTPDKVTILATVAECISDIDVKRAQAALERAKKRLEDKNNELIDTKRAEKALKRAETRLIVAAKSAKILI